MTSPGGGRCFNPKDFMLDECGISLLENLTRDHEDAFLYLSALRRTPGLQGEVTPLHLFSLVPSPTEKGSLSYLNNKMKN